MVFEVTTDNINAVDFAPASAYIEILQNVRTILTTVKGSVPLDRGFGIDESFTDEPMHSAQALIVDEIINALEEYEPRVTVEGITFEGDQEGTLRPKVQVSINE